MIFNEQCSLCVWQKGLFSHIVTVFWDILILCQSKNIINNNSPCPEKALGIYFSLYKM